MEIVTRNQKEKAVLLEMQDSIIEELNVKEVIFHDREDEMVEYSAKAAFKVLGKKLGSSMKEVATKIEMLTSDEIQGLLDGATLSLECASSLVEITQNEVIITRIEKENLRVVNDGTLTLGLDTKITEELLLEGYVRDLIRGIQNLRKESLLKVTDRIHLHAYFADHCDGTVLKKAFEEYCSYIASETLAEKLEWHPIPADTLSSCSVESGDEMWEIGIEKIEKTI